jgi:hypothetical protein
MATMMGMVFSRSENEPPSAQPSTLEEHKGREQRAGERKEKNKNLSELRVLRV